MDFIIEDCLGVVYDLWKHVDHVGGELLAAFCGGLPSYTISGSIISCLILLLLSDL